VRELQKWSDLDPSPLSLREREQTEFAARLDPKS
jgi:hypothetical protein